ncbi:hypothetical protein GCM10007913_11910 [Devosia yakushimensis]|uniref:Inorganic pyrophosphatase domain-containing protein n=1 Tax=Devosia yakushimensis TaxID=470028 RepID=A0ABQ5UAX5_9HYPH|nr:PLxRFG domain-containing protein [Devosia yakushimensis]GLQ09259.1 hypothetical protein GCM10007913_11910 [Devosia yakushimensis]
MPVIRSADFKPSDPFGIYAGRGNPLVPTPPGATGNKTGLLEQGTLDLSQRPVVRNPDGSVSTVSSMSFNEDGHEVLVPTIAPDGRRLSDDEAVALYRQTGQHLGKFSDPQSATAYAENLSLEQAQRFGQAANQQVQQNWQQLEQQDPGRYEVIDESGFDKWRQDWEAKQPGWIEDTARLLGGSLAKGTGALTQGVGAAVTALTNATTTPVINSIFGTEFGQANPLQAPADWLNTLGAKTQEGMSFATKEAIADSTPGGNILEPSTWTLGEKPSLVGYAALALDVFGQMTPVIAASIAAGPAGGAIAGGLQGGGAAQQQAATVIDQMAAEPGLLEKESAFYREQLAAGKTPEEALAATKAAAGQAAFILTAPISGLGGFATAKIIDPATAVLAGRSIVARILGRAGLSAAEEGSQEAAESVATNVGVNAGAGTSVGVADGTFADFLLGALAGAGPGAVAGALSPGGTTAGAGGAQPAVEPADAPPAPASAPTPTSANSAQVAPPKAGPLASALDYGLSKAPPAATLIVNDPALPGVGAGPEHGQTVTLASDQSGIDPSMRRVTMADGGDRVLGARLLQNVAGEPVAPDPQGATAPLTASTTMPGMPSAGSRTMVEAPGMEPFAARIEQYVTSDGASEAVIVDDNGEVLQLPVEYLRPLALTQQMIEEAERAENPPIDRDPVPESPTARQVGPAALAFPDATLASLFDLGRERQQIKRLERATGGSGNAFALRDHGLDRVRELADQLGVLPERVNEIADDYRYRAERAAKRTQSGLPQNMHGLNPDRLKAWQAERANGGIADNGEASPDIDGLKADTSAAPADSAPAVDTPAPIDPAARPDDATWWNGLPLGARKALLASAGVKRSEKSAWEKFSRGIQGRLAPLRIEMEGLDQARANSRALDAAANEAATSPQNELPEPSQAQKEAGNYKLGHHRIGGMDISIENPAGSERRGVDRGGKEWSVTMKSHYGYIRGTTGKDKDHIDIFVRPGTEELAEDAPIFVVDQVNGDGKFDEHKIMAGFSSSEQARRAYLANYSKGWKGLGSISAATLADFKRWIADGDTRKPFAPAEPVASQRRESDDADGAAAKPWNMEKELPLQILRLIRTGNALDPLRAVVDASGSNKELLDVWADTLGQHLTGMGGDRVMMQARPHGLEVTMPSPDGAEVVKKVFKGKELADLIRDALAHETAQRIARPLPIREDPAFEPDRQAMKAFKKGDKVEWTNPGTYRNADGSTREGLDRSGTIVQVHSADLGTFTVLTDGGGESMVPARMLRKPAQSESNLQNVQSEQIVQTFENEGSRAGRMALAKAITSEVNADPVEGNKKARELTTAVRSKRGAPAGRLFSRKAEPVAALDGNELGVDFNGPADMPALRAAALDWYRANLQGQEVVNAESGRTIIFGGVGGKKSINGKGEDIVRMVPALRSIVEGGRFIGEPQVDRRGRPDIKAVHSLEASVSLGGRTVDVVAIIRETPQGEFYYDLRKDNRLGARWSIKPPTEGVTEGQVPHPALEGDAEPDSLNIAIKKASDKQGQASSREGQGGRTVGAVRTELRRRGFGSLIDGLEQAGRLLIVEAVEVDAEPGVQGWTDPDGTITLIADHIAEGDAGSVLLHEAFHSGARPLLGSRNWRTLMLRLAGLYRQFEESNGSARAFFDAARARVQQAEGQGGPLSEPLRVEEFAAYAIEEYAAAPGALRKWIDDLLGEIKAWALQRWGRQIGAVTPSQLRSIAQAALRDAVGTGALPQGAQSRRNSVAGVAAAAGTKLSPKRVGEEIAGKLTDLKPALLAAVPLNYFAELKRPGMVAIDHYLKVKRSMDAYRGKKHSDMDQIAQEWRKYARLGLGGAKWNKDGRTRAAALADLMHETTLAGIDPSRTDRENTDKRGYDGLRARYLGLPPAGQQLYGKVRDVYKATADEMDAILLDNVRKTQEIAFRRAENKYREERERIAQSGLTGLDKSKAEKDAQDVYQNEMNRATWNMKARLTKLRLAFEASRVPAPYFPLARFGRYFVSVKDLDGTVISFSKRESAAEMRRLAEQMRAAYPTAKVEAGLQVERGGMRDAMDPRIVAEIESILGEAGVDGDVMDMIWQRYLETMPDLSARKRFIHRKGVAGFDGDALRTFASNQFHAAHQLGKLKYGLELQELANQAVDQAKKADDPVRGMILANELKKRHDWVMNPTGSRAIQAVTSTMFVWYLAATPAAALVNLSQTPMMAIPVLGARLGGIGKSTAAIARASADVARGRGSALRTRLSADEKRAMEAFYESGMIDRTQAHDLAGVGEVGVAYSPLRQRIMAVISWAYHNVEVWNREITALAAYRLAREAGQHEVAAIDTAHELTWAAHFDYSNSSRARAMQGDFAKVALTFQSHQVNMWYRLFRDIHQSVKGESPQARKEARYQLAGILGMMALFGGVNGFFGYNLLVALAGLAFDDDDDPRTFKAELDGYVIDMLGPDLGGIVLKGAPGHLLGIDLTSRLGMPDFFVRAPDNGSEGKDWFQDLIVGATGVVPSTFLSAIDGAGLISEGNIARGIEVMAPKAIKDAMQAYRYANEGVVSRKGDVVVDRSQIDVWDVLAEAVGFTPAVVAETYERNGVLKDAEQHVLDERRMLMNRFAMAHVQGDIEARTAAIDAIRTWNRKPYARAIPITSDSLEQSLKTRARNAAKREDGVIIANKDLNTMLREAMPARMH